MIVRVEACGRVLHVEWSKAAVPQPTPSTGPPDNVPQPAVVYAEEPSDPIAGRLGFEWADRRASS